MSPYIVLISGANRGLGKGLLELYLARPNHTVIAANRDPNHATSKALADLPTGEGSRLIVVKTDATVESDALDAVKALTAQGIGHIDLVIANAGISNIWPKVSELNTADLQAHLMSNVFGTIWLYQATLPLLLKSTEPKLVTMGSTAGCIETFLAYNKLTFHHRNQLLITNAAYGPSKAAAHWLTKRINAEEDQLNAFVLGPGWVQTELGNAGARFFGMEQAFLTADESCTNMVLVIDAANKESHGGRFWGHDGEQLGW